MKKKWQPGCPCCASCDTFTACFDGMDWEVAIDSITDVNCSQCDTLDFTDTFLVGPISAGGAGGACSFNKSAVITPICTGGFGNFTVAVVCEYDPSLGAKIKVTWRITNGSVAQDDSAIFGFTDHSASALSAVQDLCNGSTVDLPFISQSISGPFQLCDWSTATTRLQVV